MWAKGFPRSPLNVNRERLRSRYDEWKLEWERDVYFSQLWAIVDAVRLPPNTAKIVGFGCGTVPVPSILSMVRSTDSVQTALMGMFRDRLRAENGYDVPCFVQDRGYQNIGMEAHPMEIVQILDDPGGFLQVDETTIVIAIRPDIPVRQIITDIARPAVMIWRPIDNFDPETERYVYVLGCVGSVGSDMGIGTIRPLCEYNV